MAILPDAPRIPWNKIGVGLWLDGGGDLVRELTPSEADILSTESSEYVESPQLAGFVSLSLPSFDLAGMYNSRSNSAQSRPWEYSTDSIDGISGTWTAFPSFTSLNAKPGYRDDLQVYNPVIPNVRAIRLGTTSAIAVRNEYILLHVYGWLNEPADRLELWHPTLDERLPGDWLDIGAVVRDGITQYDVGFRIKNRSTTLTANAITVTAADPIPDDPSLATWHSFSDGGAFANPLIIGDLAPGAISNIVTLRRIVPTSASLGYWSGLIDATPTNWS